MSERVRVIRAASLPPLASQDYLTGFSFRSGFYGRKREVRDPLLGVFERVVAKGTPELVLVSGAPGVGKSSVVNELQKSLTIARGLFASESSTSTSGTFLMRPSRKPCGASSARS